MSGEIEQLVHLYRLNRWLYTRALEGVSPAAALARPGAEANHIAFIALHLLDARAYTASLMAGPPVEHGFEDQTRTAEGIDDLGSFPRIEALSAAWERVSSELERRLIAQGAEALAADAGVEFPNGQRSLAGALFFLAFHEGYHIGQLALLRKVVGLPALDFGSESAA